MELLTAKQAAERLGLSPRSVYMLAQSGIIRSVRMGLKGGILRFMPEDLDVYLEYSRQENDAIGKVYFIQDAETRAIKIGISVNPAGRLNQLQIGHPYQLVLLGTIPGSRQIEAELHVKFERHHLRGEWFRGDDQLLSEIRALIEGTDADDQASR